MILTEANVLPYLTARDFAGPEFVVRGEYTVSDLSRRNRNFRVSCGPHEFLVKQAGAWDHSGRASVEREADFCRRAVKEEGFAPLRPLVPSVYSYDPDNSILIFEFLPDETALADSPLCLAPETARRAGELMAAYHAAMCSPEFAEAFPGDAPGYFSIHRWNPDHIPARQGARRELIRMVSRHAAFAPAIEAAAAQWNPSALIHGDWKLENCLISRDGARLHVIDWELAEWGDPRWDAATLLQSWWNRWACDPEEQALEEVRPALRAFLAGYRADLAQLLPFAAVRMLQSAWELLKNLSEMQGDAVRVAQVSLNLLTQPDWAQRELLGE
jgi:tRNA A-37 threonylcarbamoyl transferase component Bud32